MDIRSVCGLSRKLSGIVRIVNVMFVRNSVCVMNMRFV